MFQETNILGRVGKIEQKGNVVNLSLAVSEKYKNKQGEMVDTTEWFNCVAFNRTGEIIAQYVEKGHLLFVKAKQSSNKYTDKNGEERTGTNFIIQSFSFLPNASSDGGNQAPPKKGKPAPPKGQDPFTPEPDEDLPF